MVNGFFLGGAATGMRDQEALDIKQQAEDRAAQNQEVANADKIISGITTHIGDIVKASVDAGKDPKEVVNNGTIQSLLATAQNLATRIGRDPNQLAQMVQSMALRPPAPDVSTKVAQIGQDAAGNRTYGVHNPATGAITPIDSRGQPIPVAAPAGQPALGPSDVLTPAQIQNANPGGVPPAPGMSGAPLAPAAPATPQAPAAAPVPTVGADPSFGQRFAGDAVVSDAPPQAAIRRMPPDMPPGPDAVNYAIKNSILGSEFLKAVEPQHRNTVQGIIDYKVDPDKLSKRVDKSGQSEYTRMLSWAHQADPGYDPKYYKPMQRAITEFTSGGPASPAGQITAGNTAIQHIGEMADAYDKMQEVPGLLDKIAKSNTSIASYAAARLKNEVIRGTSEGLALAAFMTARERYSAEIERFYAGGKGADAALQRSQAALDSGYSPPEMYSAFNAEGHLLAGKVNALQDRWKTSQAGPRFGDALFKSGIPNFPIIQQKSAETIDRVAKGFLATKALGGAGAMAPASNVVDYKTYFGGK